MHMVCFDTTIMSRTGTITPASLLYLLFTLSLVSADPEWSNAPWIGSSANALIGDGSDLFRTTFSTPADVNGSSAILHVATLGMGFARINVRIRLYPTLKLIHRNMTLAPPPNRV